MAGFFMSGQGVMDAQDVLTVAVRDVPVRVVADVEFTGIVNRVSKWERVNIGMIDDGRECRLFMGTGVEFGEAAVVTLRQSTDACMKRDVDKGVLSVTRVSEVESVDLFSWDNLVGERVVPAALMEAA